MLITVHCRKHNNGDPCAGVPSSTAQFNITNSYPYIHSVYTNQDTFITGSTVQFTATEPNAESYTWKIGDTTITGKSSFALYFPKVLGVIPVSLTIVQKKSDYECYKNDDSVKTYSQNLFFKPLNEWPILGKYKGYVTDNPSDTFTITISSKINPDNGLPTELTLYNFLNGCNDSIVVNEYESAYEFIAGYSSLNTFTYPNCQFFDSAYGYLKNFGDTLIINYKYCPSISSPCNQNKTFIGVK